MNRFDLESQFSLIHWHTLKESLPENGSYILLKEYAEDGYLCCEGAFEQGKFWSLFPNRNTPYHMEEIAAWAYFPYDSRGDLSAGPHATPLSQLR